MKTAELLADAFGRISDVVHNSAAGLTAEQLAYRPGPGANSIGWLLWHLTRVQDDHVSELAGTEQVWTAAGWAERFALPFGVEATGWGQTPDEVGAVRVASPDLLTGYHDAVCEQTLRFVGSVTEASLDEIVDERWDPPVTLGVRLVSVISDDLQHAGQAAYLRGLVLAG
ncbi:MAG: mycothiol transferase [Streptosporangiaceae bacterium]